MKTAYQNLGEFISELDRTGELLRVKALVSTRFEITHITDLASKAPGGGKALLFENVEESRFPVLTNAFGSERRICMALGTDSLDRLAERVEKFVKMEPPKSLGQALKMLPMGLDLLRFFPRRTRCAPCQEVIYRGGEIDLSALPVLTCWPQDGGPFVTLPVVFTRSLVSGRRNAGMYRLQVFDRNTTGMHWHIHKDGSHYFQEYRKAGRRMPVAVAIGTDPAVTYAATAPLPRGIDEMILAGFIRRKPVPMVRCVTVDLDVPAESEFVLEGYVDPDELRLEGPFGDHTGYYSLVGDYPVFHLSALTHRHNPVYPATIVGKPPMEDCYLAKATERIFLPLLQAVLPEVHDFWMPWEGVFHNIVVMAIEKEYPGHARKIMSAVWGQGQMSFSKAVALVDSGFDLKDPGRALRTILDTVDLEEDIYITEGILDVLDHSAPEPLFGSKIGIDATRRRPDEKPRSRIGRRSEPPSSENVAVSVREVSGNLGASHAPVLESRTQVLLIAFSKDGKTPGRIISEKILSHSGLDYFSVFVLLDEWIDLRGYSVVLWKIFNNVDPKRDILRLNGRMVIDATKKGAEDGHARPWPDDIEMAPDIVSRAKKRARELGIESFIG
ncbi:MAG: menaquinone biosynthesis decarboxylase [Desulfobacteraceae bacterium]|nr:menaquinone biosynthesis decarboxylase [Desulfobacteraceae bacterium]